MANWVHRTTKQYLHSWSPASLPEPEVNYIENPDLSAVVGQPNRYWTITGDVIALMDQTQMDAVDLGIFDGAVLTNQTSLKGWVDDTSDNLPAVDVRALIQNANRRINYLTSRVTELQNMVTAMCESTGAVEPLRVAGLAQAGTTTQTAEAAALMLNTATRTFATAITDYKDDVDDSSVSG